MTESYPQNRTYHPYPCPKCGEGHDSIDELQACPGIQVSDDQVAFSLDDLDEGAEG